MTHYLMKTKHTALKVIQIRNVAAIIQTERPEVIMMAEFNNDGTAENNDAIIGFRLNYLAVSQNSNSFDQDGTQLRANRIPVFRKLRN